MSDSLRRRFSPNLGPSPGDQSPVQTETGQAPPTYSLGGDFDQRLFPFWPEPKDSDPEEPVAHGYSWGRTSTLQHGELLAEREILEEEVPTGQDAKQRSAAKNNESKRGCEL